MTHIQPQKKSTGQTNKKEEAKTKRERRTKPYPSVQRQSLQCLGAASSLLSTSRRRKWTNSRNIWAAPSSTATLRIRQIFHTFRLMMEHGLFACHLRSVVPG
jgi:hypothetical protein